ncbi:hypothetical protein SBADM41S_00077 [Streptomyces badius]
MKGATDEAGYWRSRKPTLLTATAAVTAAAATGALTPPAVASAHPTNASTDGCGGSSPG